MGKVVLFVTVMLPGVVALVLGFQRPIDARDVRFWATLTGWWTLILAAMVVADAKGIFDAPEPTFVSTVAPWQWPVPGPTVRLELVTDARSAWFLPAIMLIVLCGLAVERERRATAAPSLSGLVLATSAMGVFTADNLLVGYLFMSLSAPAVAFACGPVEGREAQQAVRAVLVRFFIADLVLFFSMMVLVGLEYQENGAWEFSAHDLAVSLSPDNRLRTSMLLLVFIALAMRTGVFPFHRWLVADLAKSGNTGPLVVGLMPLIGFGAAYRLTLVCSAERDSAIVYAAAIICGVGCAVNALSSANAPEGQTRLAYAHAANMSLAAIGLLAGLADASSRSADMALFAATTFSLAVVGLTTLLDTKARQAGVVLTCMATLLGLPPLAGYVARIGLFHCAWHISPQVFVLTAIGMFVMTIGLTSLAIQVHRTGAVQVASATKATLGLIVLVLLGGGLLIEDWIRSRDPSANTQSASPFALDGEAWDSRRQFPDSKDMP